MTEEAMSTTKETVTPEQAAKILQVTPRTVYTYLRSGRLRGAKLGGGTHWRIRRADLEAFIRGEQPTD